MLRNETKYSNPHKRNASVPALLAIVGHAARMVRLYTLTLFYNILTYFDFMRSQNIPMLTLIFN